MRVITIFLAVIGITAQFIDSTWAADDWVKRSAGRSITGGGVVAAKAMTINNGGGAAQTSLIPSAETIADGSDRAAADGVQFPDYDSVRIKITDRPENTWDVSLNYPIDAKVRSGDWVVAQFALTGVAEFVFETVGPPYTKSVQYLCESESDRTPTQYTVRFKSAKNYEPGGAMLNFQLGYLEQTVQIGGLRAWTFDGNIDASQLPHTPQSYRGRDRDAKWRSAANDRIKTHRMTDVEWIIRDGSGEPIADETFDVTMTRNQFDFGTAVSVDLMVGDGDANDRYRETFLKHFNSATIENGLKWSQWENIPEKRERTLAALDWLKRHDVPARGHVMVWPGKRYLPKHALGLLDQPEILAPVIDAHIRESGYATRGRVRDWDVLNEVFDNRDLTTALGDEAMIGWFKQAREVLPEADLYYNDYAGLVRGGFPTGHKEHFETTVRYLVDGGAPIDGIGIQSHFGTILTTPDRLMAELDRWAALGLKVLITEFDVEVDDPELRADFTEDFLTCCYSHPAVEGVLVWGFWAGGMWKPQAALFNKDWTPTATGQRWIDLTNRWKTNTTVTSDAFGRIRFTGHRGTYRIERQRTADQNDETQSWIMTTP